MTKVKLCNGVPICRRIIETLPDWFFNVSLRRYEGPNVHILETETAIKANELRGGIIHDAYPNT